MSTFTHDRNIAVSRRWQTPAIGVWRRRGRRRCTGHRHGARRRHYGTSLPKARLRSSGGLPSWCRRLPVIGAGRAGVLMAHPARRLTGRVARPRKKQRRMRARSSKSTPSTLPVNPRAARIEARRPAAPRAAPQPVAYPIHRLRGDRADHAGSAVHGHAASRPASTRPTIRNAASVRPPKVCRWGPVGPWAGWYPARFQV